MAASGLGKGSLYAAWSDKAALDRSALRHYIERELSLLGALLGDEAQPARSRLLHLLTYPIDAVETAEDRRGCFLCNAAVDMAQIDPDTATIVEEAFATSTAAVDEVARQADAPEGAGAHLFSVFLGLRVMARAGVGADVMRAARDAALSGIEVKGSAGGPLH